METEFSTTRESEGTLLKFQGYNYEEQPATSPRQKLTSKEAERRQSKTSTLIGKVPAGLFTCDKHVISGVILRLFF